MSDTKKTPTKKPLTKKEVDEIAAKKFMTEAKVKSIVKKEISAFHKDDKAPITEKEVLVIAQRVVEEATAEPTRHRVFLCNVRWDHPHFGGFPMPPGVCFYGFNTFRLTEIEPGEGITEEAILEEAVRLGAGEKGLTVEGISELPEYF